MSSLVEIAKVEQGNADAAISVNSLTYAFAGYPPVVSEVSIQLPRGSRCLLIGANGAGKWQYNIQGYSYAASVDCRSGAIAMCVRLYLQLSVCFPEKSLGTSALAHLIVSRCCPF